ncbi:hypothetical protein PAMA_022033 [Pampus argenteus]
MVLNNTAENLQIRRGDALGSYAVEDFIEDMYKLIRTEKRPYSILVDESNDMCEKECAILARYYSEAQDKVAVGFIDMPVCNDAKAENIFNCIASSKDEKKSRDIEKRLTDPMMKIYTCFLHNATQSFDKFNLIFQDKAPILFKLNGSVEELLHDIGSRFIVPKVLREQNVQEIDVSNLVHCADENLFVGFLTRRHLVSEEEIPSDKTRQFFKDARSFYVRSFQKVKEKFPVRDKVLTNLSVVNPENQEDVTPEQILTLAERFPNAVKADVKEQLHLEVLDYISTNLEKVIPNYRNLAVDEFWGRLSKVKSVNTGQVRFKELCQLMKLLLVLPNSNCDVERAFSLVHHIKTEFRCQMSHQTLVNLMSCKINKFIDIECHDLEVTGKLLKSAKQAASTYNESLKKKEKE